MEKHNVIEADRTPGLEKNASGDDMLEKATAFFGVDPAAGIDKTAIWIDNRQSGKTNLPRTVEPKE